MVYTDPPWNGGNCTAFRTKANTHFPEIAKRKVEYSAFFRRFLDVVSGAEGPVYFEGGLKEREQVEAMMRRGGFVQERVWPIKYYRKHDALLYKYRRLGLDADGLYPELAGVDDELTPYKVLEVHYHSGGALVFDPCAGRGLTARAAESTGNVFIGTELNPRRMADGLMRLSSQMGGKQPKLLYVLEDHT